MVYYNEELQALADLIGISLGKVIGIGKEEIGDCCILSLSYGCIFFPDFYASACL